MFYSTHGDQWTSNTGWLTATHHRNWVKVHTDSSTDNVSKLALYTNALRGSIPEQIGQLTYLNDLYMHNNDLSGTIPPQFGQLTSLTNMYLYNNVLIGTIPAQIGELTSLDNLHLHSNALRGTIPTQIGQLTSLTDLYLHNNALSGAIPTQIQDLISLSYLYLNQNDLTGPIPNGVCDLPTFLKADCSNCNPSKDGCCNDCYDFVPVLIDQTLSNVIGSCAVDESCDSTTTNFASSWFKDPDNHPADLSMNEQVWKVSNSISKAGARVK